MNSETLAQKVIDILVPALSSLYIEGEPVEDKRKEKLGDIIHEKVSEKPDPEEKKIATILLEKIRLNIGEALDKSLTKVSGNSEDSTAKEHLQQEILKLFKENPRLEREIKLIIDINIENVNSLTVGNYNNCFDLVTPSSDENAKIIECLDQKREDQKEDTILKAEKLLAKLAGEEKEFLERVSVYREPVNIIALKEMFMEDTPTNVVQALMDKSLLETDHKGSYWLHPLIQKFSYNGLKNKKEVHRIAFNYYKAQNLPENPTKKEELQSVIEAHYHACEAREYDLAAAIIWECNLHDLLGLWENQRTLIEIYEKLLPRDHFKDEPILENKQVHGAVLGNLGNVYRDLGEQRKAIEYYEQALKISKEAGNRRLEENQLGNMGIVYDNLGETEKAIDYYEQALEISIEIDDMVGEGEAFGNMGLAYYHLGEPRKAIECYKQALKIARKIGDRRGEGADLGNLGLAYSDMGELRKAIEYYEQALKISRELGDRAGECAPLINLGLAYTNVGEHTKAIRNCEQALKISREIGSRQEEGAALGNMGLAYRNLEEPRKAIEYYEQALKISREIGDRRGEGNSLSNMGVAYSDLGEPRKAVEYYNQTLKISRELGNRREECEDLTNLGIAYEDLGNQRKKIEYYEQALIISREMSDSHLEEMILGNLGLAHSSLKEPRKAIEFFEQALEVSKGMKHRAGECAALGALGIAYSDLNEPKKAIEYSEKALKISRKIGNVLEEGKNLKNLGIAYGDVGEHRKAIEYLKQSLIIGKTIEEKEIIDFCEQKLKELEGAKSNGSLNNSLPSKNLFQTIVSKLKSKK